MGKLVHFQADGSALEFKLDRQRITIGRRPDNDVCLPYAAVSGEHAAVVTILDDSFLEDLGSTNGTLVNGAAVAKHFLRDRDEVDIGRHILVYLADDYARLEPPRADAADGARREAAVATLLVPAAVRAKHRPDIVAPVARPMTSPVESEAVAVDHGARAESSNEPLRAPRAAAPLPEPNTAATAAYKFLSDVEPALKVVSGAKAGRIVALVKDETLIGRAGVQVVALRRTSDEVRVVPIEGAHPPSVNGVRVVPEGQSLAVGDILEIAGSKLEVIAPAKRPSV